MNVILLVLRKGENIMIDQWLKEKIRKAELFGSSPKELKKLYEVRDFKEKGRKTPLFLFILSEKVKGIFLFIAAVFALPFFIVWYKIFHPEDFFNRR